jgi:hypothetical protein
VPSADIGKALRGFGVLVLEEDALDEDLDDVFVVRAEASDGLEL